jgi:hypothetical protein
MVDTFLKSTLVALRTAAPQSVQTGSVPRRPHLVNYPVPAACLIRQAKPTVTNPKSRPVFQSFLASAYFVN